MRLRNSTDDEKNYIWNTVSVNLMEVDDGGRWNGVDNTCVVDT